MLLGSFQLDPYPDYSMWNENFWNSGVAENLIYTMQDWVCEKQWYALVPIEAPAVRL